MRLNSLYKTDICSFIGLKVGSSKIEVLADGKSLFYCTFLAEPESPLIKCLPKNTNSMCQGGAHSTEMPVKQAPTPQCDYVDSTLLQREHSQSVAALVLLLFTAEEGRSGSWRESMVAQRHTV